MAEDDTVAGRWICRRCGFLLTKSIISMAQGRIGTDARLHREVCSNAKCGGQLMVQATVADLRWDCPLCKHKGNSHLTYVCAGCHVDMDTDEAAEMIRDKRAKEQADG